MTSLTGKLATTIDESLTNMEVKQNKREYKPGEALKVKMTLMNISGKIITLIFHTSKIFDFSVEHIDSEFSSVWSSDKVFIQVITERELKQEELIQQDLEWIPSKPGTYSLKGYTQISSLTARPSDKKHVLLCLKFAVVRIVMGRVEKWIVS